MTGVSGRTFDRTGFYGYTNTARFARFARLALNVLLHAEEIRNSNPQNRNNIEWGSRKLRNAEVRRHDVRLVEQPFVFFLTAPTDSIIPCPHVSDFGQILPPATGCDQSLAARGLGINVIANGEQGTAANLRGG